VFSRYFSLIRIRFFSFVPVDVKPLDWHCCIICTQHNPIDAPENFFQCDDTPSIEGYN
jgi:hypothetical protein